MWKTIYVEKEYSKMSKLGKLNVVVKDDIDAKFREKVFRKKGMKKGNITQSLEEAMLLWINVSDIKKHVNEKAPK